MNPVPSNHITKKILFLALPMGGIQLVTVSSGFLCMMMLARLGHEVLAASALIFAVQMSIIVTGMSILLSISVLVSRAFGEKNPLLSGTFLQHGWSLALLISIPIILLFWSVDDILLFFGQTQNIVAILKKFFHAYVWSVVPLFLVVCNQQFCYGVRKQRLVIGSSIFGVTVLLFTAYILIFGKFGAPALGVAGLGYAMAAQAWSVFIFVIGFFCFDKYFVPFKILHYRIHKNWNHLAQLFKIGWPISVQIGGEMLSFAVCATMVGWLGADSLAAYQVVGQYLFLVVIPVFAIAQATGILISHACGSKEISQVRQLGNTSLIIAMMLGIIAALIFTLFPKALAILYLDVDNPANTRTIQLIISLFAVVAVSQFFDGIRNILVGALRGLFDTRIPMFISLTVIWLIGIPLSYFFAFTLQFGVIGIIVGSMIGMLIGCTLMFYRWQKLSKMKANNPV